MKILQLKIYNEKYEIIRDINFFEEGISFVYGKIVKPKNDKKTSNSIGKTLLFKFISYIFGRKEEKNDYPSTIVDWSLEARVLHDGKEYNVEKKLGNSELKINSEKFTNGKYLEFFNIDRGTNSKQALLGKRSNIISSYSKNPTKEDVKHFLTLLNLYDVIEIFLKTKKEQEKLKTYNDYNKFFKDDIKELEKKQFVLLQKKTKIEQELIQIKSKIDKLNISEDSLDLIRIRSEKNTILKNNKLSLEKNNIRIEKLNELIEECKNSDISCEDIINLYNKASIVLPEQMKRTLVDVQKFYDEMFKDKKDIYEKELEKIIKENENIQSEIIKLSSFVDAISLKIAENDIFKEAMNLYEIKNNELNEIVEEYGKVIGVIDDLSNKKKIEDLIDEYYITLEQELNKYKSIINEYRTYVYNLVDEIYEDDREAYFDIEIPTKNKVKSMPIKVTLNLKGDKGEGIGAVKNIVIDLLIYYYNNIVEYLMQDSSCFEGVDKRQVATLILKATSIANEKNKQYIVSINDYHLQKDNNQLMDLVEKRTVLELSEEDLLLRKRV